MEITAENIFDRDALESSLRRAFIDWEKNVGSFRILKRQRNIYTSTFPSEIVTLQLKDKSCLKIFCKYGKLKEDTEKHRESVAYEADVYQHVLQPMQLPLPEFYGIHKGDSHDKVCLFIEFLEKAVRLVETHEPEVIMFKAASWIGRFHADNEKRVECPSLQFLNVFNEEYYLGAIRRATLYVENLHQKFPWFSTLCKQFEKIIPELSAIPFTVIHGEYGPKNIMTENGMVLPVDWQTAAIGPGEMDLVALVDRWPGQIVDRCVIEYQRSRWPESSPKGFERTFALANVYHQLRWLGDRLEWTKKDESIFWRFDALYSAGEKSGLI